MPESRQEATIPLKGRHPRDPVAASDESTGKPDARTWLAVAAGWLVPGLGHAVLGRHVRALIFGALIWGSFGLGLAHEGSLALRDTKQPFLTTLQIVANLGVGPADLLARWRIYGSPTYSMGKMRPTAAVAIYRDRIRSERSIYGTAYLWTAGLMNLLLLFDIWDIGRGRKD